MKNMGRNISIGVHLTANLGAGMWRRSWAATLSPSPVSELNQLIAPTIETLRHLGTVAVFIVEPLNDIADGAGDELHDLPGRKQKQETLVSSPGLIWKSKLPA